MGRKPKLSHSLPLSQVPERTRLLVLNFTDKSYLMCLLIFFLFVLYNPYICLGTSRTKALRISICRKKGT